ncbi:hypothetical protein GC088_09885 [Arthrobacter sp. JZ12]|uniref:hypothetical protein n=1 Tax=Arthrobacter sp. JZ12 TaxID=2654190 RepID=UPI002B467E8A|nr:hypothetical protein [Arthrobacter sp. JZ12]WRH25340.1 hypothetical protein GC088_09885 [Arthrobacter sp. JZ12]
MTGQRSNALVEKVGPFYDLDGLATWLNLTHHQIQARREKQMILACSTADGEFIYPAWQFRGDGEILPGLSSVLRVLATGINDGWTWALWLQTAIPEELGGKTVTDWLRNEGDVEPVLQLAAIDAAAWSS